MSSLPMTPDQAAKYREATSKSQGSSPIGSPILVLCHKCNSQATRRLCTVKKVYKEGFIQRVYTCAKCQGVSHEL